MPLVNTRKNILRTVSVLLLFGVTLPFIVGAEIGEPSTKNRQIALMVRGIVSSQHLTRHELDDEISERSLATFIDRLDPMKLYFLQEDIDAFESKKTEIDDMLKSGELQFAHDVFLKYMSRMEESITVVHHLIDAKHDFTVEEYINTDWDNLEFAKTREELTERWRKRIKYNFLVLKGDKTEGEDARERLHRRYSSQLKQMEQTKSDDLLEIFLTSVTTSYDPHTTYMSPTSSENFEIQMRLNLDGIGAQLTLEDGYTKVTRIIPGGAADKQGELKTGDRIVSVGQDTEGEMQEVIDMKLNDVVSLIRGKPGSTVRLGIIPEKSQETKVLTIKRAKIELKDSEARGEIIEHNLPGTKKTLRIGVINLPSFYMDMDAARKGVKDYRSTTRDCRRIIDEFNEEGIDGMIMDLSTNGGGSLTEAIDLTGLFIDLGTVVQVKDPSGRVQQYDDRNKGTSYDGPLVVLCSKFSASASEIFAGAIVDHGRGIVVGDSTTHGKGTVQNFLELGAQFFSINNPPNLGALKITTQQFYRPGGASTQQRGVYSDIILPSITDHLKVSESDLDYPVPFDKVDDEVQEHLGARDEEIIAKLKAASEQRIEKSEDFQKLLTQIDEYKKQQKEKRVSLVEEVFFAKRDENSAQEEAQDNLEKRANGEAEVFPDTFYNREVLTITGEYIKDQTN
ncbi:MAG: carboxy terminal-processing peptidase [Pirellulales bacterium]|nr:carboxy terminal-processing peptidase [Pirellulales bacterium]